MKIHKAETVTRYQVTFTPRETKVLLCEQEWRMVLSTACSDNNGGPTCATAMLTRTQINRICDTLGVNGREWFETEGAKLQRGYRSRYRAERKPSPLKER